MDFLKKHLSTETGRQVFLILILILSNLFVWFSIYERRSSDILSVYFLDVGQGDAILIDSPSHNRILVDGGKNRQVLTELGRVLPFGDRRIDVVLATHPDADHIGGLPEIISRYDVEVFIEPGVLSENSVDDELNTRLEDEGTRRLLGRRGMVVNLGDGVKLQILFPTQNVSNWETNRASIVARLVYGENEFLLTGDSPKEIENVLLTLNSVNLESDVLKAGHHGSRTSTSLAFVNAVGPEYAVISAGRDNSYGHPHKEVLDILEKVGAKVVSTIELGTITFQTDGEDLNMIR